VFFIHDGTELDSAETFCVIVGMPTKTPKNTTAIIVTMINRLCISLKILG